MTVGLELALLYTGGIGLGGYLRLLPAVYLVFLSLALMTALALLFSTFSTPALSALFTFFLWIIGHFGSDLQSFGKLTKSASVQWLCRILYYVIPNLSNFSNHRQPQRYPGAPAFPADRSLRHRWAPRFIASFIAHSSLRLPSRSSCAGISNERGPGSTYTGNLAFYRNMPGLCRADQAGAGSARIAAAANRDRTRICCTSALPRS